MVALLIFQKAAATQVGGHWDPVEQQENRWLADPIGIPNLVEHVRTCGRYLSDHEFCALSEELQLSEEIRCAPSGHFLGINQLDPEVLNYLAHCLACRIAGTIELPDEENERLPVGQVCYELQSRNGSGGSHRISLQQSTANSRGYRDA